MMELDITKLKVRVSHKQAGTFYSLCTASDGSRIFAGSSDYSIYVFDPAAEKFEPVGRWTKHENYVSALARVAGDGRDVIVSGGYDRHLVWWEASSGEVIRSIEAHDAWIRNVVAVPDGSRVISAGDDMRVKVWDSGSGALVNTLEGHAKRTPQGHVTALYVIAVTQDGRYLASGDRIGEVRVWDLATGELAQSFQVPILYTYDPKQRKRSIGGIRSLAFSPDGKQLAVGGIGQIGNVDGLAGPAHVELWDWQNARPVRTAQAEGHKAIVQHLEYSPCGGWLVGAGGGSDDGLIAFWKIDGLPSVPSAADAESSDKPLAPVHRHKTDLHIHRFCFNRVRGELFAAGHGRLDIMA